MRQDHDLLRQVYEVLTVWCAFPGVPKVIWSGRAGDEPWRNPLSRNVSIAHAGFPQYERVVTFFSVFTVPPTASQPHDQQAER